MFVDRKPYWYGESRTILHAYRSFLLRAAPRLLSSKMYVARNRSLVKYWPKIASDASTTRRQSLGARRSQDERRELMAVWPDVVEDVARTSRQLNLPEVAQWLRRALEYNVPGGKCTRALTLLYAYRTLVPSDRITRENLYLARVLAWCVELLQGFLLVLDDVEDRSLIRRERPCWYRLEDVGFAAINDAVMIESVTYHLLRQHLKDRDCYVDILETCHEIMLITLMGQCLEFTNYGSASLDLDKFTMDLYDNIARCKTAYYTFVLPTKVAMHLAGTKDRHLLELATEILLEIGHLYQVQDDYLSCYGRREIVGKIGTDIEEGKCTWLAVTALRLATPEQRDVMRECYGADDPDKVERVKRLYGDLDLPRVYLAYEKETYDRLSSHIERMSCALPKAMFREVLDGLYRRAK